MLPADALHRGIPEGRGASRSPPKKPPKRAPSVGRTRDTPNAFRPCTRRRLGRESTNFEQLYVGDQRIRRRTDRGGCDPGILRGWRWLCPGRQDEEYELAQSSWEIRSAGGLTRHQPAPEATRENTRRPALGAQRKEEAAQPVNHLRMGDIGIS